MDSGKIIFRFYKDKIKVQKVNPSVSSNIGNIDSFRIQGMDFYKISKGMSLAEEYKNLISYIKKTNSIDASGYESICIFLNQFRGDDGSLQEVIREADSSCGMTFSSYKFLGSVESFLKAVKTEMQKGRKQILGDVLFTDKKSAFLRYGEKGSDSYFLLDAADAFHNMSCEADSSFQPKDYKNEYYIDEHTFERFILGNLSDEYVKNKGGFIEQYSSNNNDKTTKKSILSEMIERFGSVKTYSSR